MLNLSLLLVAYTYILPDFNFWFLLVDVIETNAELHSTINNLHFHLLPYFPYSDYFPQFSINRKSGKTGKSMDLCSSTDVNIYVQFMYKQFILLMYNQLTNSRIVEPEGRGNSHRQPIQSCKKICLNQDLQYFTRNLMTALCWGVPRSLLGHKD